jgi:GNAT superfamily N-acetyltransferase
MRAQEFIRRQLREDIENFPIANVRKANGAIGNQGVNIEQAADVLTHAAGMQVSPDMSMRQLVDALRADPAAQQRLRQFVQKNPVTVYALPDGSYHLQDGHHRTFLLNLLGDETVPAVVKEDVTEAKTVEFEGLTLKVIKQDHELTVDALDEWGNKVLGHVKFNIGDGKELDPQDLRVDDKYQGQGIARVMYDYVKSLGYTINRSWDQTDAGAGFWNKHRGEDVRVWEQDVAEGLTETRNSLFAFVKQQFPTWPDYVLKDFLYPQAKGIRDQAELDDFLKRNKQDFGNCKWTLTKLPITFDIFTPKTQRMLASREGGSSNPFQVPRDAERHAQQLKMIQQTGVSAEPIIVAKLPNGYDLIEGWHRTIQHLQVYPNGYTAPAWVCTGATYKSENVEQDMAENFADGKNPGRKGLAKRSGVNTKASVSSLRKTAKNSSGEKQRMSHWLANMKAGRAKAKRK